MNLKRLIPVFLCLFVVGEAYSSVDAGEDCAREADSLRVHAGQYEKEGAYDQAAGLDTTAAVMYRECGKQDEEARALERAGFCLWRIGNLDLSLSYYRRARDLYVEYGGLRDMASVLNRIGLVHWRQVAADSALVKFEEVVRLGRELGDSSLVARGLGNAGMVYRHLGQYSRALRNYSRCLSIHRLADDERKQALALGNMGVLFSSRGQYREALLCFQEALERSRKTGDTRIEGRVLGNMGIVYWNLRQFEDAHDLYMEQLQTARDLQNRIDEATCLDNLGNLEWAMGNEERALKMYRQAWSLYRETGDRRSEGIISYDISQVHLSMGDFEEARKWNVEALEIFLEVGDRWSEALALTAAGDIELGREQPSEAIASFDRALGLVGESGSLELSWYGRFGKAKALQARGDLEGAIQFYREAIEGIEGIRSRINLESLSVRFLQDKMEPYVSLAELLIRTGRVEEAFRVSESAHARTLLDVMSQAVDSHDADIPEDLLRRRSELESEMDQLDRKLLSEHARPGAERDRDLIESVEQALLEARRSYEELIREIDLKVTEKRGAAVPAEPADVASLRQGLIGRKGDVALLEYLVGEDALLIFVVTGDSVVGRVTRVGKDSLSSLAENFRRPFMDLKTGKTDLMNLDFSLSSSQALYDVVIRPVENPLEGISTLVVIPDAALHYVPFEALTSGRKSEKVDNEEHDESLFSFYRTQDYLLDHFVVAYAPSASIINEVRKDRKRRDYSGELYAVGDPYVGEERMTFPYVGEILSVLRGELDFRFSPLPGAREEVRRIGRFFEENATVVLTGEEASEMAFKEHAPGHRYIHLATHGVADDREPLYSKIILGLDDHGVDDGFLHAYEVSRLNLNCELVVLSACETALGPLSGAEGLLGLSRSFLQGGASSVIASLWSVDESTALIMEEFYRHLPEGKGKALREAKLAAFDLDRQGMSMAHPFFWAPFVLIGDWE